MNVRTDQDVIAGPPPPIKSRHDQLVALVEQMLDLHRQLAAFKTPDERTRLERQIGATDQRIDVLVYELYGLTDNEIAIIEGAAQPTGRVQSTEEEPDQ